MILPPNSSSQAMAFPENVAPVPVNNLLTTTVNRRPELELSDDLGFFRDAVNGFAVGGIYCCGGPPGCAKSLLQTQMIMDLGRRDIRSLVILTEEQPSSLKERAIRITQGWESGDVKRAMTNIHADGSLWDVASFPAFITRNVVSSNGPYHGVKLVVMDSIQGHGLPAAATKAYSAVLEGARLCAENGVTVMLISQVTKRGEMCGPRLLEHGVDAAVMMRRAMQYSMLSVRKNRFGPPLLRPIPLRIDPVTTALAVAPHVHALPGAANTYAGAGSGLLQLQASVTVPPDGRVGRVTAPGLPRKEIEQLLDCLTQIEKLDVAGMDYRIQCRLPGNGVYQGHFGLPLCMALVASHARKAIPEGHIFMGEVDLFRKVLPLPANLLQDLQAALDAGDIPTPVTLMIPPSSADFIPPSSKVRVVACRTLEEAIFATWPDMRD